MENGFIYLTKASGLIALFYFAYLLLLRKETFFNANRWFLLLGLITSSVLPLFFITKIIWVEPTTDSFDWSNIPVTTSVIAPEPEINWYLVLACVYFTGIVISFLKLVFDFNSLIQLLKGKTIQQKGDFKLIDIDENIAPFSYFNYIVCNSSLYTAIELENILEHEKVHSLQKHSVDVLISRFFCVLFWFNPLIWLYKKAIAQNLEFIADGEAAKKINDKKAYQLTLLKITTQENCVTITNHFYQSLIKKRIIMLNKNQSKKWNSWKYATVFPTLVAFVFLFQIEVLAKEKTIVNTTKTTTLNGNFALIITKNTTDASLKNHIIDLKDQYRITLNISKVKRNVNCEITGIKISFKDEEGNTGINQANGDKPIQPIKLIKNTDKNGKILIGFFTSNTENQSTNLNENLTALSKDKKIYINGGESSKSEMDKLNPKEIESIDVIKDKKEIRIFTKNWLKKSKEFTFYIDDKKVTPQEYYSFNPEMIECSHGNIDEKTIRITTKKVNKNDSQNNDQNKETEKINENPNKKIIKSYLKEYYINGKKSTAFVYSKLDINNIDKVETNRFEKKVIITTKTSDTPKPTIISEQNGNNKTSTKINDDNKNSAPIDFIKTFKKALVVIDGKESNLKSLLKIKDKNIKITYANIFEESTDKTKKITLATYGEKARKGVLVVETSPLEKK